MIRHGKLWLYGFWQKKDSDEEFIVYGVDRKVLLGGLVIQAAMIVFYLFMVLNFPFEETLVYLMALLAVTGLFLFFIQKHMYWLEYNSRTRSFKELNKGFKTPVDISGEFTMNKKTFTEKSGYIEE